MNEIQTPNVKKGDKILLKVSHNGTQQWEGKVLEVMKATDNVTTGNITVKSVDGTPNSNNVTLYYRGPGDVFVLADRKEQAKFLKEKNKKLIEKAEENKVEINRLLNFDSDEAEVADKLSRILSNPNAKSIEKVLRELKRSDFL